jgi:serine/threonine protein kinase
LTVRSDHETVIASTQNPHASFHQFANLALASHSAAKRQSSLCCIADFGVSRVFTPSAESATSGTATASICLSGLTAEHGVVGTTSYMSPEQIEGKKVDVRSDLFSFGIVMYEALMGQRPFKDDTVESVIGRILTEEPNAVTALKPVIRQCLKKDRGNRMQTAQQLYSTVEDVQQEVQAGTVLVDVKNMSGSSIGNVSRRPRWAVTTFLLVVIASILTFWFFDSDAPLGEIPYRKIQLPMPASTSLYNGPAISLLLEEHFLCHSLNSLTDNVQTSTPCITLEEAHCRI